MYVFIEFSTSISLLKTRLAACCSAWAMIDRWSQNTSDGIGYIDEEGGKGYHLFVKLNIHMYMKIHVSSMLAIGIETINKHNKQTSSHNGL